MKIYIPIWIDLKAEHSMQLTQCQEDLHSNMDRFESNIIRVCLDVYALIYIPIWIDLKGVTKYT